MFGLNLFADERRVRRKVSNSLLCFHSFGGWLKHECIISWSSCHGKKWLQAEWFFVLLHSEVKKKIELISFACERIIIWRKKFIISTGGVRTVSIHDTALDYLLWSVDRVRGHVLASNREWLIWLRVPSGATAVRLPFTQRTWPRMVATAVSDALREFANNIQFSPVSNLCYRRKCSNDIITLIGFSY